MVQDSQIEAIRRWLDERNSLNGRDISSQLRAGTPALSPAAKHFCNRLVPSVQNKGCVKLIELIHILQVRRGRARACTSSRTAKARVSSIRKRLVAPHGGTQVI
jgi:hypothetical protein